MLDESVTNIDNNQIEKNKRWWEVSKFHGSTDQKSKLSMAQDNSEPAENYSKQLRQDNCKQDGEASGEGRNFGSSVAGIGVAVTHAGLDSSNV